MTTETITDHEYGPPEDGFYECIHCHRISANVGMLVALPCIERPAPPDLPIVRQPNGLQQIAIRSALSKVMLESSDAADEIVRETKEKHRASIRHKAEKQDFDVLSIHDYFDQDDGSMTVTTTALVSPRKMEPQRIRETIPSTAVLTRMDMFGITEKGAVLMIAKALADEYAKSLDRTTHDFRVTRQETDHNGNLTVDIEVTFAPLAVTYNPEGALAEFNDPTRLRELKSKMLEDNARFLSKFTYATAVDMANDPTKYYGTA